MKVGVLFSGGKDSCFACYKAIEKGEDVVCLISVFSENKESYMFHTPNIELVKEQAEAIGLPLICVKTKGEKEKELLDMKIAIGMAKEKYDIKGVVTGALFSKYQAERIKNICDELELKCINPLWHADAVKYLNELVNAGFKVMIVGVFAEGFDEGWLGRVIDKRAIKELEDKHNKYRISPAGEGGK